MAVFVYGVSRNHRSAPGGGGSDLATQQGNVRLKDELLLSCFSLGDDFMSQYL